MRKLLLPLFCGLIIAFLFAAPSFAQQNAELESCFVYYNYGKVKTHLATDKQSYKDSETITVSGMIENQNTFPISDVTLYGQLRRLNTPEKFETEGHFLIDRLVLLSHLSFLPGESKWIEAHVPVKTNYPKGSYQLQYYIFSPDGFHYSGRPFLEEDVAGYSNFDIDSEVAPSLYFDLSSLTVNGTAQTIRGGIKEFLIGPLSISVKLTSEESRDLTIPVHVALYSFDDASEDNRIRKDEMIIKPRDQGVLTYTFIPEKIGAYVYVATIDAPVSSVFKYRFAVTGEGEPDVRLNDLNITDYPIGTDSKAYLCFHSPAPAKSRETEIKLEVLNGKQEVVETRSVSGSFDGSVQAISVPITTLTNTDNLTVKAIFTDKTTGQVVKNAQKSYSCDTFSDSIHDIALTYDETKPDRVLINALGICGKPVGNGYIEHIKILKEGKVVKEDYHKIAGSVQYSLSGLTKGVYTLDVKSGSIEKQLAFTLVKSLKATPVGENKRYVFMGVLGVLAIGMVVFLVKRIRRRV